MIFVRVRDRVPRSDLAHERKPARPPTCCNIRTRRLASVVVTVATVKGWAQVWGEAQAQTQTEAEEEEEEEAEA